MSAQASCCNLHCDELPNGGLDTVIVYPHCGGIIPPSAALSFDGNDYVWHFCGHDRLAGWCDAVLGQRY